MKLSLYFLILLLCSNIQANNEYIKEVKLKQNNDLWNFIVVVDLPEGCIVSLRIFFCKNEILNSRNWQWVKNRQICYNYGPIKKEILSGPYFLELVLKKSIQISRLKQKLAKYSEFKYIWPFFMGNRYRQHLQLQEYASFYQSQIKQIKLYTKQLEEKAHFLLQQENFTREAFTKWFIASKRQLKIIQQQIQEKSLVKVLLPYSPKNMQDLKGTIKFLQQIRQISIFLIKQKYQLKIASAHFKTPAIQITHCKKNIDQLLQQVSQRENDLEKSQRKWQQYIKWLEQMHKEILENFATQTKNFQKKQWKKQQKLWLAELDFFKKQGANYQKLPIAKKSPSLLVDILALAQKMQKLLYNSEQTLKKGQKDTIFAMILEMRQNLQKIKAKFNLLLEKNKESQKQKFKDIFVNLQKLNNKIDAKFYSLLEKDKKKWWQNLQQVIQQSRHLQSKNKNIQKITQILKILYHLQKNVKKHKKIPRYFYQYKIRIKIYLKKIAKIYGL